MHEDTGNVAEDNLGPEGASLPEGTAATVRLPPALQAELEEVLEEADREEGISWDELSRRLQKPREGGHKGRPYRRTCRFKVAALLDLALTIHIKVVQEGVWVP